MILALAWIGTGLLCAAPFFIDTPEGKAAMICGLSLLSIQAIERRLWNLLTLNSIGVIGYAYNLFL